MKNSQNRSLSEGNDFDDSFISSANYFLQDCLNEKQKRLYVGLLAILTGNISQIHRMTGKSRKTIRKGKNDLVDRLPINQIGERIRRKGGGRKSKIDQYEEEVKNLLESDTAADPMSGQKWTRVTLRNIAGWINNKLCPSSISKLLRQLDYGRLSNRKTKRYREKHPMSDFQRHFISLQQFLFLDQGIPVISIDAKKKELIGLFKQDGKAWRRKDDPVEVYDKEYPNRAEGTLLPFGFYDLAHNTGYIVGGTSLGTSEFAVDALIIWFENEGWYRYPNCEELYLTCDAGRPNQYRGWLFKYLLQTKFVDKFGITVHISHYASGDSKYNSIEGRVFSFISDNFAGTPLKTHEVAMNLIRGTETNGKKGGLTVNGVLHEKEYERGLTNTFTEADYRTINISRADICGEFNYTIRPRNEKDTLKTRIEVERENIVKQVWHFSNKPFQSIDEGIRKANELMSENDWKYHVITGISIKETHRRRADGGVGAPGPETPTYFEYHFELDFDISTPIVAKLWHLSND